MTALGRTRVALPWFLFALSLLHISVGLHRWQASASEQALPREWLSLWRECRSSIEEARALHLNGLMSIEPSSYDRFDLRALDRWRLLGRDGSRFTILESERDGLDGNVFRGCKVMLSPQAEFLNAAEENSLLRAFLDERNMLVLGGTHEFRDTDPVPPLIVLALQRAALDQSGCLVAHLFVLDRESATVSVEVAEVLRRSPVPAAQSCGAPSMLKLGPTSSGNVWRRVAGRLGVGLPGLDPQG